jgi:glycosyltransferase involved in cell wall biosynthesis
MRRPVSLTFGSERPVMVSVAMTTYNQEQFIDQAIQSVLSQETDFPVELVIGEDYSTDRTRPIVIQYARRYPRQIRLLLRATNLGPQYNLVGTLSACRGRYVALLEGDDYWTSTQKLQKQVAFLESHPQCAQCFHAVTFFFEDGRSAPLVVRPPDALQTVSTLEDLLRFNNYMQYCSVMFRRSLLDHFPDWCCKQIAVDWLLFILIAQNGWVGFLDETMAAYRMHSQGVWSGLSLISQQMALLESYKVLKAYFGRRFDKSIRYGQFRCYYKLAMAHLEGGNIHAARSCAFRGMMRRPFGSRYFTDVDIRFLLRLCGPLVFKLTRRIYRAFGTLRRRLIDCSEVTRRV